MSAPTPLPTRLGDHVGWVFDTDESLVEHCTRFAVAGLRGHHKVVVLTASLPAAAVRERMCAAEPGLGDCADQGRLDVLDGPPLYLSDGRFEPDRVTGQFARTIAETAGSGFPGIWVCADMTWAAGDVPGAESIATYEALANRLYAGGLVAGVCQYDARRFDRATLDAVCAAHPITPGQAALRFRGSRRAPHLVISGEVDLSNSAALGGLLAQLPAGDVEIDATGLRFADGASAWAIANLAATRGPATVTVRCGAPFARILSLVARGDGPGPVVTVVPR